MSDCVNAMTVDVEDYFQVSAFEAHVPKTAWNSHESRVCRNTDRLLEIFAEKGIRATFFVLGWVADRHPELVKRIIAAGHELASHGYAHRLVYDQSPMEFREDVRRSKNVLEQIGGAEVLGYRAPSFSITRRSLWALDVLAEEGFTYDSSIYPILHDRYGMPDAPRHCHVMTRQGRVLWELPGSTVSVRGRNLPIGGGGYFRLLPYAWTRFGFRTVNRRERKPVIFYLHPWEIDPGQPRLRGSALSRFRHYHNLHKTEERLQRLLSEFRFDSIREILSEITRSEVSVGRQTWQPSVTQAQVGSGSHAR